VKETCLFKKKSKKESSRRERERERERDVSSNVLNTNPI
jgi:hypothetical protein